MGNALKKGLSYNWSGAWQAFKAPLNMLLTYFVPPLPCPAPSSAPAAHLALVDGHGPGQLEGQLLPAEEPAPSGLHCPAFGTDDLGGSTQEPDLGQPCGRHGEIPLSSPVSGLRSEKQASPLQPRLFLFTLTLGPCCPKQ